MNAKTIPVVATIATVMPGLLLFGGVVALGVWLLSDDKKKPETAPAAPERKLLPNPPNPPGNSGNPPHYSAGQVTAPLPVVTPVYAAPAPPKVTIPQPSVIPAARIQPDIQPLARKKGITHEDMAKVFSGGARGLTRMAAVSALKTSGFGRTAAYDALSPDGRFSAWLKCAPDGLMTWIG
jgi:hypothetical protein